MRSGEWKEICNPMNDHIGKLPGAEYVGAIGMAMNERPNSLASKRAIENRWTGELSESVKHLQETVLQGDKLFGEPVFIFRKNIKKSK